MDRAAFARLALEHVRETQSRRTGGVGAPGAEPFVDEAAFAIVSRGPDGTRVETRLDNYYPAFAAAGPAERAAIAAAVARASQLPTATRSIDEARSRIVPRVRTRRFFEYDAGGGAFVHTVLGEHLGVGIAVDHPEHVEYVSDPSRFGASFAQLDALARENLRGRTRTGLVEVRPGLWVGAWNDDYAPSRMLFPELFEAVRRRGAPVVFVAGPERLLVGTEGDIATLTYLADAAEQRLGGPQGLIGYPFVLRADGWHRFDPGGELGLRFSTLLARDLASAYGMQREMLIDGRMPWRGAGELPYVGSVLHPFKNNPALTLGTWSEGTDALVPQTELVAVAKPDGRKAVVPWRAFETTTAAVARRVPDLYPPRWWARGVIDEETFAALLRHDVGGARGNPPSAAVPSTKPTSNPPPPAPRTLFRGRTLSVTQSGDLLAFRPEGGRELPSLPGTKTLYLPEATLASASLLRSFLSPSGEVSIIVGAASLALVGDFRRVDRPTVVELGPLPEAEAEALLHALQGALSLPRQPRYVTANELASSARVELVSVEGTYEAGHRDATHFAGVALVGPRVASLEAGARYRVVGYVHPPPAGGAPSRSRARHELYVLWTEAPD